MGASFTLCLRGAVDCAMIPITASAVSARIKFSRERRCTKEKMIEVDFNSSEAIYIQLRNQIILGIATSTIQEGDSLPSVRQLAETVGVNMHTVNKAYNVLKQEGFISLDKRRGAVIALDADKLKALEEMREQLRIILAKGCCKNITREEVHELVDEIFEEYGALV